MYELHHCREVKGQLYTLVTLYPEKEPRAVLNVLERREISCPRLERSPAHDLVPVHFLVGRVYITSFKEI
jgi:hypothetical protein